MTLPLENLLDRVSAALRQLPGAVELYLFGSAADSTTRDAYADLDLQVVTEQYSLSRSAWPGILQQAGKIKLAYTIRDDPQESAYWIAFAEESPYHKVDIGLCDQQSDQRFLDQVQQKVLLWRQPAKRDPMPFSLVDAYFPVPGTAAHFLLGELMGSVRYVKARKRGQHLTCWRFLSAKFNALLRCYQWNGDCDNFPQASLNTWDYTALDRTLSESERLSLLHGLSLQSPQEMDCSLIDITKKIAAKIFPDYLVNASVHSQLVRESIYFIEHQLSQRQ